MRTIDSRLPAAWLIVMLVSGMAGCSKSGTTPAETTQTTEAKPKTAPTATAPPVSNAAAAESAKVNLDEIFPKGRGRELVLNNCTACHTFVPIVTLQMSKDSWERNRGIHRERVPNLTDDEINVLYSYLEANFNPNRPPAKLPQALLDTWTGN